MSHPKKSTFALLVLSLFMTFTPGCTLKEVNWYVSPSGDDSNPETIEQPFATIEKARTEVKLLTGKGLKSDVLVNLREGLYLLDQTIVFGLDDGGNDKFSVTYQAYPGETAVISSG